MTEAQERTCIGITTNALSTFAPAQNELADKVQNVVLRAVRVCLSIKNMTAHFQISKVDALPVQDSCQIVKWMISNEFC